MSEDLSTYANLIIMSGPGIYYPDEGGYFAGVIDTRESDSNGLRYLLFVSPKEGGETNEAEWKYFDIETGANSVWNGYENTQKLIDSPAASFCRNLNLSGYFDWYLPAKDELEVLYRVFKPTVNSNDVTCGLNKSSNPKRGCYTSSNPSQTKLGKFKFKKLEAFVADGYWSSTEYSSDYCWYQSFYYGYQHYNDKNSSYYVRAVRRLIF